ncbi:hypothetical protein ACFV80_08135 [Streptomyces sp. NPDC059862]|uniref:hypothetical protein n=1 Tax=Streptomyces sp. NPDC059862 TaxID=3346975 RepID=UPI00366791C9
MRALPARRMASSALCAALLVGITGPVAMAADSTRERTRTASPDARLPGADTLHAQVRKLNALGSEFAPVTELLNAVLKADDHQLSAAEARKLGDAAKAALAKVAAKAPATSAPTAGVLPRDTDLTSDDDTDLTNDELDAMEEAIDSLVEVATTSDDESQVLLSVDDLLNEVWGLIDGLLGTGLPILTPLPSTSTSTTAPPASAVTLPDITPTQTQTVLLTVP